MATAALKFGRHKYGALNLLLAKWLRLHAQPQPYVYVTLGGTELKDISNLDWIDRTLGSQVYTFEQNPTRYVLAEQTATRLRAQGVLIDVFQDDLFTFTRTSDDPHIFYLDLFRICSPKNYQNEFATWFDNSVIRPGDFLIVTSYLGRKTSWENVLKPFDPEFTFLNVTALQEKKSLYNAYHPAMMLNRALRQFDLQDDLKLIPLCWVKYFDTSTMGIYGIRCEEGKTALRSLVTGSFGADLTKKAGSLYMQSYDA
jgi:hypothetical protein